MKDWQLGLILMGVAFAATNAADCRYRLTKDIPKTGDDAALGMVISFLFLIASTIYLGVAVIT